MSGPPAVLIAVDLTFADGAAEVVLSGELDCLTVPELSEQLDRVLDKEPDRLVLDMRAVTFIDVGAARMLAGTVRQLPGGTKPVIRNPSLPVRKLLRVAGFDAAFQFQGITGSAEQKGAR